MGVSRRDILDGFVLEHDRGRLEVHELAPGVIFQDYYGTVVDAYYDPVMELAAGRLTEGHRLTFFSDISRVTSSPTLYRRNWATWFKTHDDRIDDIVVLLGSTLGRMAVKAANLITGGSIRAYSDPEQFQAEIERVVVSVWESVDSSQGSGESRGDTIPSAGAGEASADPEADPGMMDGSSPAAFASPLEREVGLGALNAALFGDAVEATPPKIGRFEVRRRLGSGGMGVVFACRDGKLGRDVAVKLLHGPGDRNAHRRLLREAKAMARLSHPSVVTIHEIGEERDTAFLVMELVRGVTLRRWLDEGDRPEAEILEVFGKAGEGLAAAHAKGLVHRDFKPENVMIDGDGRVLVMDFGLARTTNAELLSTLSSGEDQEVDADLTTPGMIVGTPAYMAPEQFQGKPTDARSDQFAYCVALWEALFRQRPFPGTSLAALARAVVEDAPVVPRGSTVPRHLREALERGLRPDPGARWESMSQLMDALSGSRGRGIRWLFGASRQS